MKKLLLALLISTPLYGFASTEAIIPTIHFQAKAEVEVPKDLMSVTLFMQGQDSDSRALSHSNTKILNETIASLKQYGDDFKIEQGNRSMTPIYERSNEGVTSRNITGWSESIQIHVKSKNFSSLADAIHGVAGKMDISSVTFSASDELLALHSENLLKEAIGLFYSKAETIAAAAGDSKFELIDMHLPPINNPHQIRPMMMKATSFSTESMSVEAGSEKIIQEVSGSIKLLP